MTETSAHIETALTASAPVDRLRAALGAQGLPAPTRRRCCSRLPHAAGAGRHLRAGARAVRPGRAGPRHRAQRADAPSHWLGTDTLGRDVLSRLLFGIQPSLVNSLIAVVVFLAPRHPARHRRRLPRRMARRRHQPGGGTGPVHPADHPGPGRALRLHRQPDRSDGHPRRPGRARPDPGGPRRDPAGPRGAVRHRRPGVRGRAAADHDLPRAASGDRSRSSCRPRCSPVSPWPSRRRWPSSGSSPSVADPTWGGMIGEAAGVISRDQWLIIPPGVAIALTVLAFGLLGDAIRDLSSDEDASAAPPSRRPVAPTAGRPPTGGPDGVPRTHGHQRPARGPGPHRHRRRRSRDHPRQRRDLQRRSRARPWHSSASPGAARA